MENSRELKIRKQIDAYVKGLLSEEEIQSLWDEFAKNPELLDILEIEAGVKAVMEKNRASAKQGATLRTIPRWTWHAAAAAVILIVAFVQLFRTDTPTELNQFTVNQIKPDKLETADGLRDEGSFITTADSLLNLGFQAFISGDDERALELFNTVIQEFDEEPYASKAFLNKGIVLYNGGNYSGAVTSFRASAKRAIESRMISEKAYWYLGNALINLGELEEARDAVFKTYQLDGIFRTPAFKLLKKLNYDLGKSDYEELEPEKLD